MTRQTGNQWLPARPAQGAANRQQPGPPHELTSEQIKLGTWVGVYEMWAQRVILDGPVVEIIEAGAKPPARVHLEHHFVKTTDPSIPTRPSKYRRYIVQRFAGRCFVYPENPTSYRFVPGTTRDDR